MIKFSIVFIFSIFLQFGHAQNVLYVNSKATNGKQDGSSWSDAFTNLQDALKNKNADTIYLAEGVYYPSVNNDRSESFDISHISLIKGGFGMENNVFVCNPDKYFTILSGDIGNLQDTTDNSNHILTYKPNKKEISINGLQVENSNCIMESATNNRGGGMFVDNINAVNDIKININQCVFKRNIASSGGAIYFNNSKSNNSILPNIQNTVFKKNTSGYSGGGAIYLSNIINKLSDTILISNCQFNENFSYEFGGGIKLIDMVGIVLLKNNYFEQNQATEGGCFWVFINNNINSKIVIDSCHMQQNISGGGNCSIYKINKQIEHDSLLINVFNSTFHNNTITANVGGALEVYSYIGYSSLNINNCKFDKNKSQNDGGVLNIENGYEFDINIDNSIFSNNSCYFNDGYGVMYYRSNLVPNVIDKSRININNSLFINNKDCFGFVNGIIGTIDTKIYNCTFFNNGQFPFGKTYDKNSDYITKYNTLKFYNTILWERAPIENMFYNGDYKNPSIIDYNFYNCLINTPELNYNNYNADFGGNILLKYPQFKDTTKNDFSLFPCSPVINKGDRKYIDSLGISYDLAGNPRIYLDSVDIGAYESQSKCTVDNTELDNNAALELIPNLVTSGATIQIRLKETTAIENYHLSIYDIGGLLISTMPLHNNLTFEAPQRKWILYCAAQNYRSKSK
jgi:predicted outer membrane repeat protein